MKAQEKERKLGLSQGHQRTDSTGSDVSKERVKLTIGELRKSEVRISVYKITNRESLLTGKSILPMAILRRASAVKMSVPMSRRRQSMPSGMNYFSGYACTFKN